MSHPHLQEHIDLIAKHEQDFFANRTRTERAGDAVACFVGSLTFVLCHIMAFVTWILLNALPVLHRWQFDPYPFALFDTIVALEAILLASFILMRQTRIGRRSDEREHLMLQMLLLTEKEVTALLQINREIAQTLGLKHLARNTDIAALSQETSVDQVADSIREALPHD